MVEEANPSAGSGATWTCPRCGAPLPRPGADGFSVCEYCGVRTEVSTAAPAQLIPSRSEDLASPPGPSFESDDEDFGGGTPNRLVRGLILVAVLVVVFVVFAATQPASTPAGSTSSSAPHCSVTISASATSGPVPFTATFTAEITSPAGDSTSEPMWQFGPFPPGYDINFTYGNPVTHTWDTSGSFGVHVSVPDSTGQGCYYDMSINAT